MNPVRQALYMAIDAATTAPIYHSVAPSSATFPLIIFNKQSGTPQWQFADRLDNELWQIKAVDKNTTAGRAEDIATQIDDALNRADLAIAGKTHLFLLRESDVDYSETESGATYYHVGALYRLMHEPGG
jgi:hypothetical protein